MTYSDGGCTEVRRRGCGSCVWSVPASAALFVWPPLAAELWAGVLAVAGGTAWAVWAVRTLGFSRFVGRPGRSPHLVLRGPYRLARHPFYLGVLVALLGVLLATRSLAAAVVCAGTALGFAMAIRREERRLLARFGDAYRRYRAAVPAFVGLRRRALR